MSTKPGQLHFGRLTQDGALTYGYDGNGNRTTIGYPGGVEASTTFDFADREATLSVTSPAGTQPVVTSSAYLPSGPLTSLALGNGATETRAFTSRYFPAEIALDATRDRTYAYATDAVGNITAITETVECLTDVLLENRTITGAELHQSCDEATAGPAVEVAPGGSLTLRAATRVVLRDGFSVASGASFSAGTDPDLDGSAWTFDYQDPQYFLTSATGPWGDLAWTYDRIGNRLTETRDGATDLYDYTDNLAGGNTPLLEDIQLAVGGLRTFTYGAAGHLEAVDSAGNLVEFTYDPAGRLASAERASNATPFTYDGRSYLTAAGASAGPLGATHPTYSSAGLLHTLTQRVTTTNAGKTHHVFHFAGRPVAQLTIDDATETWRYLTTDHLGTPLVATDAAGAELWAGPFEPFGRDRLEGTNLAAAAEDVFLRMPGQWDDEVWKEATRGAESYYNVHRWYSTGVGRYSRPDPFGEQVSPNRYHYAAANPVFYLDPLGLLCQMTPKWRGCLSRIFGFPVQQIRIVDRSALPHIVARGKTFTSPGTIYLPGPCSDFWSNTRLVLHEFYHVIDQWDTNRMRLDTYLLEGARQEVGGGDGHDDNRFEEEANHFAWIHRKQLRDCLGCEPLPPEPEPPFTPIRQFCEESPALCEAGLVQSRRGPF